MRGPVMTLVGAVAALVLVVLELPWAAVVVLGLTCLWLLSGVYVLREYVQELEQPIVIAVMFEDEPEPEGSA